MKQSEMHNGQGDATRDAEWQRVVWQGAACHGAADTAKETAPSGAVLLSGLSEV